MLEQPRDTNCVLITEENHWVKPRKEGRGIPAGHVCHRYERVPWDDRTPSAQGRVLSWVRRSCCKDSRGGWRGGQSSSKLYSLCFQKLFGSTEESVPSHPLGKGSDPRDTLNPLDRFLKMSGNPPVEQRGKGISRGKVNAFTCRQV